MCEFTSAIHAIDNNFSSRADRRDEASSHDSDDDVFFLFSFKRIADNRRTSETTDKQSKDDEIPIEEAIHCRPSLTRSFISATVSNLEHVLLDIIERVSMVGVCYFTNTLAAHAFTQLFLSFTHSFHLYEKLRDFSIASVSD